jgi:hypothetical protein
MAQKLAEEATEVVIEAVRGERAAGAVTGTCRPPIQRIGIGSVASGRPARTESRAACASAP